jgi:hypothetical protein
MPNQQPAHEIRLGAVKATIWENETANGKRYNVTVARLYKDGDQWKRTESVTVHRSETGAADRR